jgi:hypothetical protein
MHPIILEAIEHFRVYYPSDLYFIRHFHEPNEPYVLNFSIFLHQFQVKRWVIGGEPSCLAIINEAREIQAAHNGGNLGQNVANGNPNNLVDQFANWLNGVDGNHLVVSGHQTALASKILFLCDPIHITPFDANVRQAVNFHAEPNNMLAPNGDYAQYLYRFCDYNFNILINQVIQPEPIPNGPVNIDGILEEVSAWAQQIEGCFNMPDHIHNNFYTLRKNRLKDKILWVVGRHINQGLL